MAMEAVSFDLAYCLPQFSEANRGPQYTLCELLLEAVLQVWKSAEMRFLVSLPTSISQWTPAPSAFPPNILTINLFTFRL